MPYCYIVIRETVAVTAFLAGSASARTISSPGNIADAKRVNSAMYLDAHRLLTCSSSLNNVFPQLKIFLKFMEL